MKITPEDIMWGWDPFKEDTLLGFKKLSKDKILLGAIKYALYHRGYTSSLDAPAISGIKKFKSALPGPGPIDLAKWGSARISGDRWTQKTLDFEMLLRQKNFARDVIDEMIVDSTLQMERDGYTQLQNHDIPDELTGAIVDWTMAELIRLGILTGSEELSRVVRGVYL